MHIPCILNGKSWIHSHYAPSVYSRFPASPCLVAQCLFGSFHISHEKHLEQNYTQPMHLTVNLFSWPGFVSDKTLRGTRSWNEHAECGCCMYVVPVEIVNMNGAIWEPGLKNPANISSLLFRLDDEKDAHSVHLERLNMNWLPTEEKQMYKLYVNIICIFYVCISIVCIWYGYYMYVICILYV